jgi:hypothetical protein
VQKQTKKKPGWWCDLNGKSACLATVRPEFKPQYHKKKKRKKEKEKTK